MKIIAIMLFAACHSDVAAVSDAGVASDATPACVQVPQIAPCYESPPLPDGGIFGTHGQYAFMQDTPTTTTQFAIYSDVTHVGFEFINLIVGWRGGYDTTLQPSNYWALDVEPQVTHVAGNKPLTARAIHCSMRIINQIPGDNALCMDADPGSGKIQIADGANLGPITTYGHLDLRDHVGATLTNAICQSSSCVDSLGTVQPTGSMMTIVFAKAFVKDDDAICFVQGLDGAVVAAMHVTKDALTATVTSGARYHYFCPGRTP
jgi:hypothetical protein